MSNTIGDGPQGESMSEMTRRSPVCGQRAAHSIIARDPFARVAALASLALSLVIASCTLWLPLLTRQTTAPGPQPRETILASSNGQVPVGAVALVGPVILAIALVAATWSRRSTLTFLIAGLLCAWAIGFFVTILIGFLIGPVAATALLAAGALRASISEQTQRSGQG